MSETRRVPEALSTGEELFALQCSIELHPVSQPAREYRFAAPRRWRFDFAWPDKKVAVEIEGGTWVQGRHNRGSSIAADLEKYNTAALLGWRVLRYTTAMVKSGAAVAQVMEAM